MSKLDELIKEYCPDGVKYKRLIDVAKIVRGTRITKKQLVRDGKYKVISGGVEPMGSFDDANREEPTITIASYGAAGYVNYITEPFWANDVCLSVSPKQDVLNKKYLYYVLKQMQGYIFSNVIRAVPEHIPTVFLENLEIPILPIQIQEEIVRILDSYTEYKDQLVKELKAELEARRKQYEFYRSQMLSFGKEGEPDMPEWLKKMVDEYCPDGVEVLMLKDVVEYGMRRIPTSEINEDNYVGVENLLQNKMGKKRAVSVPSESAVIQYLTGDVLIGNIRPYLKKIWLADRRGGTNGDVLVLHIKNQHVISPKYLYYATSSEDFFDYDTQNSKGAKMPRGDKEKVMEYQIQVPPLPIQEAIVKVLDNFSSLCEDLSAGIPAEIEAVEKQYEYYRDKLLTFETK